MVNYLTAAYTYDGNGLRVKKVSGSTTTVYAFSGSRVIAEYDNGALPTAPTREYIYAGGTLLAKIDSSGTNYYHQDHLSNRLITDSSGNTVAQQGHFPYGEQWYPVPPASPATKWEFTTYERDSESGNDYAQARYNMSRLARLSSPDPLSGSTLDPQSLNRYSYSVNDPANIIDPSGLCPKAAAQNGDTDDSQNGSSYGPSMFGENFLDPEPQQLPTPCYGPTDQPGGHGGYVWLDGGLVPPGLIGSGESVTVYSGSSGVGGWLDDGQGGYYNPVSGCFISRHGRIYCNRAAFDEAYPGSSAGVSVSSLFGPQEPGGPGGGGGGKKYGVKLAVLNDCLSKMGIKTTIDSFTPSTPGGYGKASGKGEDWFSGHGNTVPITVSNDAHTYNAAQISGIVGKPSLGFTDPFHPYTNYTNNNNNAYGTVDTQVWELGNSLWQIQAGSPFVPWPPVEPGKTLENCVRTHNGIQPQ